MVPLPVEQTGESAASESRRALPTPFLTKTYQLVDDASIDDLISWNEEGTTFVVWRPAEFARDLLPKYFKHDNFSSFVRQLNTYGFRKVVPDRWEFANEYFRRGEKGLLREIQRRKISQAAAPAPNTHTVTVAIPVAARAVSPANSGEEQVLSSSSSPAATSAAVAHRFTSFAAALELLEENELLRKENSQLRQELNRLRGLCDNIYALVTNYASGNGARVVPEAIALDLLPGRNLPAEADSAGNGGVKAEDVGNLVSPRLFGVPISVKRVRQSDDEDADKQGHDKVLRRHVSDVKSEELGGGSDHR